MERTHFVWPFDLQYVLNSEFKAHFSPLQADCYSLPHFILLLFAVLRLWGCGALAA